VYKDLVHLMYENLHTSVYISSYVQYIQLMINSIWINLVSLGSVYFAIDSLFKGNWSVIIVYIIGSVMGKWVAMTKITDYREKIYSLLLKRKLKEK